MKKPEKIIPLFKPSYGAREIKAVGDVMRSGWIGLGPKTAEFEESFASYVGSKYAIALNSATSALHLSLIAAGVKEGDEVIVPALTFTSTAHAVEYLGAKAVFADVEVDTLCISPADVANKITSKTKAIIPVHYGGHPCKLDELKKLARKNNLVIIEDAAHACGSLYKGKKIGGISPFTCFSFHAVKNIATADGGMITTNNKKHAELLKRLRWMGINKSTWGRIDEVTGRNKHKGYGWYYEVVELGYKYHMNDITAAIGLVQLSRLEETNQKRKEITDKYNKGLAGLEGIKLPTLEKNMVSAHHNYAIRYNLRDKLYLYLLEHNISSGVHYFPLHLQPYYKKKYPGVKLPITESEWQKILLLPIFPDLKPAEQDYITSTIRDFVYKHGSE